MTWRTMDTAPTEEVGQYKERQKFLAVRDGQVIICWWDDDRYAKKPKPFWDGTDRIRGRLWIRETPPVEWMPLPKPSLTK